LTDTVPQRDTTIHASISRQGDSRGDFLWATSQARPSERFKKRQRGTAARSRSRRITGRSKLPAERLANEPTGRGSGRPRAVVFRRPSDLHRITNPLSRSEVLLMLHVIAGIVRAIWWSRRGVQGFDGPARPVGTRATMWYRLRTMQRLVIDLDQAGQENRRAAV